MRRRGKPSSWTSLARGLQIAFLALAPLVVFAQQATAPPGADAEKVRQLLSDALDANTPEQKLDLAKQVLLLDSSNQAALTLRSEALQEIEQKKKESAAQTEKQQEKKQQEHDSKSALDAARKALLVGDLAAARTALGRAKQLGASGPEFDKLDGAIKREEQANQQLKYVALGGAGVALLGIGGVVVWMKRKKEPYLEVTDETGRSERYKVENEITAIGAVTENGEKHNDIVVSDRLGMISRFHCQIHQKNGKLYLVDCNSSNGTFLDGRRIPPRRMVPLRSGARIDLARSGTLRVGFKRKKA